MFMVVIDVYSKWLEIFVMEIIIVEEIVSMLCFLFVCMGFFDQMVLDNGLQFMFEIFRKFIIVNGIKYVIGVFYYLLINGQVERLVQSFKKGVKVDKFSRIL